ncbi:hypothetical protein HanRHA438_Chr06g0281231 [Helianthus annuus]|nr:hypothetical protein HanRHA438_Chr06g0281231 [Helianthus annuus]
MSDHMVQNVLQLLDYFYQICFWIISIKYASGLFLSNIPILTFFILNFNTTYREN